MAKRRAKGEGSISHNPNRDRWEGRIELPPGPDGKRKRRLVTGRTKADVADRMKQIQAELDDGLLPASDQLTVAEYLDRWLTLTLPGTVATRTVDNYGEVVRLYISPHIGRRKLRNLTPDDVTAMIRALDADGKSTNTQRLARSVLRRALRRAQQEGSIIRNVAAIADGPKVRAKEGRTLTPQQARTFLEHIATTDDERIRRSEAAWVVMLSLGLRRGELLGLRWEDLKLDTDPPTLSVGLALKRTYELGLVVEEPKTKGSRRTVVLPSPVVAKLRTHRARQAEERLRAGGEWVESPLGHDLVFRTPFGTALDPDNLKNMTYKATQAAGLGKWSPHELRHSAASILFAQGLQMKDISEVLGHSSIRITADVYAHLITPSTKAADAMNDALFRGGA